MATFIRRVVYIAVASSAFGAGLYTAVSMNQKAQKMAPPPVNFDSELGPFIEREESRRVHDNLAPKYDSMVGTDEAITGVAKLREALIPLAKGRVLEVAVGSGRNFSFYSKEVKEIVAVDYSDGMLTQSMQKAKKNPVTLKTGDAHELTKLFPGERFDTVVDTFGLCSFEKPVQVLEEMQKVCKPEGQILLLEHGSSTNSWLQSYMEKRAHAHASKWACFYNRDIDHILEQSGLIIVRKERHHFGTTHLIVAKPSPKFYPEGYVVQESNDTQLDSYNQGSNPLRQEENQPKKSIQSKLKSFVDKVKNDKSN